MKYFRGFLLIFIVLLVSFSALQYWTFIRSHPERNGSAVVNVWPGAKVSDIQTQLKEKGVEISTLNFKIWARTSRAASKLRKGEYVIDLKWSDSKILSHILYGLPLFHSFTIKEGLNIYDIEKIYGQAFPKLSSEQFQSHIRNPKRLERMGIPVQKLPTKSRTLEGFLFPETYAYQIYDSAESLVEAQLAQFTQRALPILKQHPWASEPDGIFRLVTLASIVEKESGDFSEQPIVASVFWNRIMKKMRLESDPTIIYPLLPLFDGNIRKSDIQSKNDYNTYRMNGLPKGPIANPGESAIRAVVEPAKTNYLFFVSKGDGTHVFSEDYSTHNKYVKQYILKKK